MPTSQMTISPLSATEIATLVQGIASASSPTDTAAGMTAVSATLRELRDWCGPAEVNLAMMVVAGEFAVKHQADFAALGPDWCAVD